MTSRRRLTPRKKTVSDTCRSCTSCRRKKIKCDGCQPGCGPCEARGIECHYPQDARRTALRAKKEEVQSLRQQVETLQAQIRSGNAGAVSLAAKDSFDQEEGDMSTGTHTEYTAEHIHTCARLDPPSASHENNGPGFQGEGGVDHLTPVARSFGEDITPYPSLHLQDASGGFTSETPGQQQHEQQETSPDDQDPQVYGVTSLLHNQDSVSPMTNSRTAKDGMDAGQSSEYIKERLISYSAVQRQQEEALKRSPSLMTNIDFDNVPMDLAMHLLDLHWNRQHLSYLLTYRPAMMDSLIKGGPYMNKLLLNAIYLQSSLYSDRESLPSSLSDYPMRGEAFFLRFKGLLSQYIDRPSIATIVALLTCGACLVPHGKQSAGWAFSGIGYRMVIDLGCHLDIQCRHQSELASPSAIIETEFRRRIYWAAYVSDKLQSLFLGRAPAMPSSAGKVLREYLDSYEEMELWTPYVDHASQPFDISVPHFQGRPSYALSTFQALLKLCEIIEIIIENLYSITSVDQSQDFLLSIRARVRTLLGQWADNLPSWLSYDPEKDATPPPHQITPHTTYWALIIITEQAFLLKGHLNVQQDERSQKHSRQECVNAALHIWKLVEAYKNTFTLRRAQYGIAYATYCATLVMLQQTALDCEEHIRCIRFFWYALLEYQRGCNSGLKRPLRLLKTLMSRFERVTQNINIDDSLQAEWLDIHTMQADFDSVFLPENIGNIELTAFMDQTPLDASQAQFTSEMLFGIADDSMYGTYM